MQTLTRAEKLRLGLMRMTKGNPQLIMLALDGIKEEAKEALRATLEHAEPSVLKELDSRIDQTFKRYEQTVQKVLKSLSDDFSSKLGALAEAKFSKEREALLKSIKADPQFKGGKGDRPSNQELRDLISLLMPAPVPGPKPTESELRDIATPLLAKFFNETNKTPQQQAEEQKKLMDLIEGIVVKVVADKISQVKRFGGGGASDGSSGVNVNSLIGTISGSNTSFTYRGLARLKYIVSDGITYFEGNGYSKAGNVITMDVAPSQYIKAIT